MAHKAVYTMKDVVIKFYKDAVTPGVVPTAWSSGVTLTCIATGVSIDEKQDAALVHGQGSNQPVGTRVGVITYEWSIDALYTNDAYSLGSSLKLSQLIESEMGFFAMQIADGGDTKVLTYCTVTGTPMKVGEGEGLTISLSGIAEAVATT